MIHVLLSTIWVRADGASHLRMRISVQCQVSKNSPETNLPLRETTHLRYSFGTNCSFHSQNLLEVTKFHSSVTHYGTTVIAEVL